MSHGVFIDSHITRGTENRQPYQYLIIAFNAIVILVCNNKPVDLLANAITNFVFARFQLNLIKVGDDGDVSNFIPNSEWMLVKLHAERHVEYYR